MSNERILDISWGTILKISIAALVFYVLYLTRQILTLFLFALIISILFNPAIEFLQKRRIPRVLAVIFLYLFTFGILGFLIYLMAPFLITEVYQFSQLFPQYFEKISPSLKGLGVEAFSDLESFMAVFGKTLENTTSNFFGALSSIFGGIFSTFLVITIALFLSLEEKAMERALSLFFPKKYETYALHLWSRCQRKVSGWFGVRILGCVFVGITTYIALLLFNVKYPFGLAIVAGVLEFVPIIGPLVAGAIAFLIVSLDSMTKALFVLLFFILIQQIEGNILTPVLSKKFIGLPPVLVLVALAIGGELLGILGAILTIPFFGILFEFLRDFLRKRKEEKIDNL